MARQLYKFQKYLQYLHKTYTIININFSILKRSFSYFFFLNPAHTTTLLAQLEGILAQTPLLACLHIPSGHFPGKKQADGPAVRPGIPAVVRTARQHFFSSQIC